MTRSEYIPVSSTAASVRLTLMETATRTLAQCLVAKVYWYSEYLFRPCQ